jgi:hypothetical protein
MNYWRQAYEIWYTQNIKTDNILCMIMYLCQQIKCMAAIRKFRCIKKNVKCVTENLYLNNKFLKKISKTTITVLIGLWN